VRRVEPRAPTRNAAPAPRRGNRCFCTRRLGRTTVTIAGAAAQASYQAVDLGPHPVQLAFSAGSRARPRCSRFPLDDHIHSRLTHSLEVATVRTGSLGTLVGQPHPGPAPPPQPKSRRRRRLASRAACLAHDNGQSGHSAHVGEVRDPGVVRGGHPRPRPWFARFLRYASGTTCSRLEGKRRWRFRARHPARGAALASRASTFRARPLGGAR